MFDPVTAQLIRSIESLEDLDINRLPELLTQAFTEIVSARIQLGEIPANHDRINAAVDQFSRLANTLEPQVLLSPDRPNAASVAYVAAQSHLVVEMGLALSRVRIRGHLAKDSISPVVSAMLLFLIANQPADAAGVAVRINTSEQGTRGQLLRDLTNLAIGDLGAAADGASKLEDVAANLDPLEQAADVLYQRIAVGVRIMTRRLLALPVTSTSKPDQIFSSVVQDALYKLEPREDISLGRDGDVLFNAFTGPFQLASLLRTVWGTLRKAAVVNLPPPIGISAAEWQTSIRPILRRRPYLWPNHLDAVNGGFLDLGKSAVLTFPTGAGKSTLAELKIAATLCSGRHVLYLAPTHALVAQVRYNLRGVFGQAAVSDALPSDEYYAETDDGAVARATVTAMTPERCLASIGLNAEPFAGIGLIVFDECHLIHPRGAGQNRRSLDAMLTVLNLFTVAPGADWLLISAMLSNGDELAAWLAKETGRPCNSFKRDWKPTRQARGCLVFKGSDIDNLNSVLETEEAKAKRKPNGQLPSPPVAVTRQLNADAYAFVCLQQTWQTTFLQDYTLVNLLKAPLPLGGTLSFNKKSWRLRPNKNEVAAQVAAECAKLGMKVLVFVQQRDHTASVSESVSAFADKSLLPPVLDEISQNILRVATEEVGSIDDLYVDPNLRATCHHALMLPVERDFAERVFRNRDGVNVLAATPTLAQGINLPADVVLIVGESRYDTSKQRNVPIDAHEILNAAGRAGRAGHVAQGLVLVVPNDIVAYQFGDKENTLGGSWETLRSVFAQTDQCLKARDPVQLMLDQIQLGAARADTDALYFLRRLPIDSAENPGRAVTVLKRSLGAFLAATNLEKKAYERKIAAAITARDALGGQTTDWRAEIASLAGVTLPFVQAIDATLAETEPPNELMTLVEWFFAWLDQHKALVPDALGYRLARYLDNGETQMPLFDALSCDATRAWMNGDSVRAIADILTQGADSKRAKAGREFVLRAIPEIAFAIGIVAQVQRHRIDQELTGAEMSLALATAGLCIREGCPSPEIVALRLRLSGEYRSRRELVKLWQKIATHAGEGDLYEKFGQTRRRVGRAYSSFAKG
jgi:hypothetical protein